MLNTPQKLTRNSQNKSSFNYDWTTIWQFLESPFWIGWNKRILKREIFIGKLLLGFSVVVTKGLWPRRNSRVRIWGWTFTTTFFHGGENFEVSGQLPKIYELAAANLLQDSSRDPQPSRNWRRRTEDYLGVGLKKGRLVGPTDFFFLRNE